MIHYLKTKVKWNGLLEWKFAYIDQQEKVQLCKRHLPGFHSLQNYHHTCGIWKSLQRSTRHDHEWFCKFNAHGSGWNWSYYHPYCTVSPVRLNQREQEELDNDDGEAERTQYDVWIIVKIDVK